MYKTLDMIDFVGLYQAQDWIGGGGVFRPVNLNLLHRSEISGESAKSCYARWSRGIPPEPFLAPLTFVRRSLTGTNLSVVWRPASV